MKYRTLFSTVIVLIICSLLVVQTVSAERQPEKLPDAEILLNINNANEKSPEDTSYCEFYSDYDNISYFWRCPNQYGEDIFAQRFDNVYNKRLSSVGILLYDTGEPEVFYDAGFYLIVFDVDVSGAPGNELMRYHVPASDIVLYPDTTIVNFYDSTIVGTDLFIGAQSVESSPGFICVLSSDHDGSGPIRSYVRETQPDTTWGSMDEIWGNNVNFCIIANYCFNPRTIRVPEDFPNIRDAVNIADEGDTILVNDGVYWGDYNQNITLLYKSVILKSVNGPEFTQIDGGNFTGDNFLDCVGYVPDYQLSVEIDGFTFRNFSSYDAIINFVSYFGTIKNSVFYDNHTDYASTICLDGVDSVINCTFFNNSSSDSSTVIAMANGAIIENTIISFSPGAKSIAGGGNISCTNIYGNELDDWNGSLRDILAVNGNMSVDPMFCDTNAARDLHINEGSFCNPLHPLNSCGERIGFYGVDCSGCDDDDGDGICNETDNCQTDYNPLQENADYDYTGNACDPCPNDEYDDADADGFCADVDNCPTISNPTQSDVDSDGIGDLCDCCPDDYNPDQIDTDEDGLCDACEDCPDDPDNDIDADGFCVNDDNCPTTYNPNQTDTDSDGVGDLCDNCLNTYDPTLADSDNDGIGDVCDECTDTDNDGYGNPGYAFNTCPDDNCPQLWNPLQEDIDADGVGDTCDGCVDTDNDGFGNPGYANPFCDPDNCPTVYNPDQIDTDKDSSGDECDNCPTVVNYYQEDTDADSVGNHCDNCPFVANPNQEDTDSDGQGDICDGCCLWSRGNIDNDPYDNIDIADLVYFIDYSFGSPQGPAPVCFDEANVDAVGSLDIADVVYLVTYMFNDGPAPVICP